MHYEATQHDRSGELHSWKDTHAPHSIEAELTQLAGRSNDPEAFRHAAKHLRYTAYNAVKEARSSLEVLQIMNIVGGELHSEPIPPAFGHEDQSAGDALKRTRLLRLLQRDAPTAEQLVAHQVSAFAMVHSSALLQVLRLEGLPPNGSKLQPDGSLLPDPAMPAELTLVDWWGREALTARCHMEGIGLSAGELEDRQLAYGRELRQLLRGPRTAESTARVATLLEAKERTMRLRAYLWGDPDTQQAGLIRANFVAAIGVRLESPAVRLPEHQLDGSFTVTHFDAAALTLPVIAATARWHQPLRKLMDLYGWGEVPLLNLDTLNSTHA